MLDSHRHTRSDTGLPIANPPPHSTGPSIRALAKHSTKVAVAAVAAARTSDAPMHARNTFQVNSV
jgi:hypothetical protein